MTTHPSQEPEIPEDVLQKLEMECEDDCEYADSELSAAWKMGYMVRAKAEYLRHLHYRPFPPDKPYANLSPLHSAMWIVLHGMNEMSHRKEIEEELENLRRWLLSYPRWVAEGHKPEADRLASLILTPIPADEKEKIAFRASYIHPNKEHREGYVQGAEEQYWNCEARIKELQEWHDSHL